MYGKRDDFDFDFAIVNFPVLVGGVPLATSYGVHIPQFIRLPEHLVIPITLIIEKKKFNCYTS